MMTNSPTASRVKLGRGALVFAVVVLFALSMLAPASASTQTVGGWQNQVRQTPTPGSGCFKVSYPSTSWVSVPCGTNPHPGVYYTIGGTSPDWTGSSRSAMTSSVGQVTSESTFIGEYQEPGGLSNDFSIQLNTNTYPLTYDGHSTTGWEQFIYGVQTPSEGGVMIEYWLLGYNNTYDCTSPFSSDGLGDCTYLTSPTDVSQQGFSQLVLLNQLTSASFYGKVTSSTDTAEFCFSSTCWARSAGDLVSLDNYNWRISEWNFFGNGGGSEAYFEGPFSLGITVDSYVKVTVSCYKTTFTGESNNMTLGSCSSSGGQYSFSQSG